MNLTTKKSNNHPIHPVGSEESLVFHCEKLHLAEVGSNQKGLKIILEPVNLVGC